MENKNGNDNRNSMATIKEKIIEIANKDFAKLSAVTAILFSVCLWIIKAMWYSYISGRFSVYKIDKCYINTNSDDIFLQAIFLVSIFVIWFVINYIYYKISISEDNSKFHWKRILKIVGFWLVEMFFAFLLILNDVNIKFVELIKEIKVLDVVIIIVMLISLCLLVNIYTIEFLIIKKITKESNEKDDKKDTNEKEKRSFVSKLFKTVVVTVAVEIVIIYLLAGWSERERKDYKVIMVQAEEENSECVISCRGNEYRIYPVVYENEEYYIISRLYKYDEQILIDYNFQNIIDKEGQETIYIDNIFNIK